MNKWKIIKIKNKNSEFDFRLITKDRDYSDVNFFKYSMFRILVSLSSYLSNGVIFKEEYFKIISNKKIPTIFDFSITKFIGKPKKYLTINDDISDIVFVNENETFLINTLSEPDTKIFNSLYLYEEINDIQQFLSDNINSYSKIKTNPNFKYITTGWVKIVDSNYIIIDLLKFDKINKKTVLTRCKIYDKKILSKISSKKPIESYCLFMLEFKQKSYFKINNIIPISFDEYLTYIYDSMLPYKYDFNDVNKENDYSTDKVLRIYKNDNIQRNAFAIDPDGSKDRDDAIAAFYLDGNMNSVTNFNNAVFLKLMVHISDTLDYISPKDSNYYYHYSKYKCNTDYLDKYNLPMMDRILSENYLSLDGDNKSAITINIIYKIKDKKLYLIEPIPEKVILEKSKNLNIFGTTYKKFSESFDLNKKNGFSNESFINRKIINCNKAVKRDFNEFIHEGDSLLKNGIKNEIANNLKQMYIFFVNSLNHTGKDTLIKLPSNLVRKKISGKENIFMDFSPVDMWSHSLVEYTALESNIYFSYLMYYNNISDKKVNFVDSFYQFSNNDIIKTNKQIGVKNLEQLVNNSISNKKIKSSKNGIFRNLVSDGKPNDFYLNKKIRDIILKISKKKGKDNVIKKFLDDYDYKGKNTVFEFFRLILGLRQMLLLIDSDTNLDVSLKLISKEIKMKAKYQFFPMSHVDICSNFYTHATSPMRRFIDINVHNLIFKNEYKKYIFNNLDLDLINNTFKNSKSINQLVNNYRFVDMILLNKNFNTPIKLVDTYQNTKTIGFTDLANFFVFKDNILKSDRINKVDFFIKLNLDSYRIPKLVPVSKQESKFNIFFHMLNSSIYNDPIYKKKSQKFLEKIFKVKKIKNSIICK